MRKRITEFLTDEQHNYGRDNAGLIQKVWKMTSVKKLSKLAMRIESEDRQSKVDEVEDHWNFIIEKKKRKIRAKMEQQLQEHFQTSSKEKHWYDRIL